MKRNQFKAKKVVNGPEPIILEPIQVKAEEVGGDLGRMIKKFSKKIRKYEVLKPYYSRLMYFETKSQRRRAAKFKSIYEQQKRTNREKDE